MRDARRMLLGTGVTPILTFPPQGGRDLWATVGGGGLLRQRDSSASSGMICGKRGMGPRIREDNGGRGRDLFDAAGGDTGSGVHYDGIGKHVVEAAFIYSQTDH